MLRSSVSYRNAAVNPALRRPTLDSLAYFIYFVCPGSPTLSTFQERRYPHNASIPVSKITSQLERESGIGAVLMGKSHSQPVWDHVVRSTDTINAAFWEPTLKHPRA